MPKSLQSKLVVLAMDTIRIDTLSVVQGSIRIFDESGQEVPVEDFSFDYAKSLIIITNNFEYFHGKLLNIEYRTLPIDLSKPYYHKDTSLIIKNFSKPKQYAPIPAVTKDFFSEEDQLSKNGSISRGIVVGNQRDLSTLSNLNLQLSGKLNDEVSILAAISDNNTPIQPDGNTQQIQEFDKVSILMFTKKSGIELGDISMAKPSGYYLSLKKQTRGLRIYSIFTDKEEKKFSLRSELTAGLAKGKYKRQSITGVEGNQGPYKLTGEGSETYIVVLSGSEKVYLDGKLLIRGEKFDYVIDYNAAEIVFTANVPITKDSRILVEFEYTQQFYPRLQFLQTNRFVSKKSDFWFNFYLERDNKNDPLSENYSSETKSFLSRIGDSINNAYALNARNVGYSNDKVLYRLKDSLVDGILYDSVFAYSVNPDLAVYQLGFSYIGENMGNYRPVISNANGKVYEWVAPAGGVKQGSYEPISLYMTPKKSLLTNIGGTFKIWTNGKAKFELALSGSDANTYSKLNKEDDFGYAAKFNLSQNFLTSDTSRKQLSIFANYRLADKNFKPIENFYDVEFERNWNLPAKVDSWQEQYYDAGFLYWDKKIGIINGKAGFMIREKNYEGKFANFASNIGIMGIKVESELGYLKTNNSLFNTDYLKHKLIFSKQTKYFVIGISEETENNRWVVNNSDSLASNSFRFTEYSAFVKEPDSSVNQYFITYKYRKDYSPINNILKEWNSSQTAQAGLQLSKNRNFFSKTIITYRKLNAIDSVEQSTKNEDYVAGRQEITVRLAKGAVIASGFYETGSGLELQKQYQFIEVPTGQGQYTWIDYNQNNVKELDEFELAKFPDEANYIQVFTPSNQYMRLYTTQLNQTLSLQPERAWNQKKGLKQLLARFSDQYAFHVVQKATNPDFMPDFSDNENLITRYIMMRNNFSFKSVNRKIQIDYLLESNSSKSLLISGIDSRKAQNQSLKFKYQILKFLTAYNTAIVGSQSYSSEYFSWKNYNFQKKADVVSFDIQMLKTVLSTISYKFETKNNQYDEQSLILHELKISTNQEMSAKTNLQAELSYISADYKGELNSPIAYEMLEGLKNGENLLWGIRFNQKLSKVLYLNLSYNGRLSDKGTAIHNGSVQIRANF